MIPRLFLFPPRSILLSFSSTDLPFLSHRFLLILIAPLFSLLPWSLYVFSLSSCLYPRKMSPSLSGMSARVQAEFRVGSQTMSLLLEMLDNIGHRGSSTEHEVDNSYKSSKIKRERMNREVYSIDSSSKDMFVCLISQNNIKWRFNIQCLTGNETYKTVSVILLEDMIASSSI